MPCLINMKSLLTGAVVVFVLCGANMAVGDDLIFREDFDGSTSGLLSRGWSWINKNNYSFLAGGKLYINPLERGSFEDDQLSYHNFIRRWAPYLIEYTVETSTQPNLYSRLAQSDIMLYTTNDDYVRFGLRLNGSYQLEVFHVHRVDGVLISESYTSYAGALVHLRIHCSDDTATLEYSNDGADWSTQYTISDLQFTPLFTGLIAFIEPGFPMSTSESSARFYDFVVRGAERTITVEPLDLGEDVGVPGPIPAIPSVCTQPNTDTCAAYLRPSVFLESESDVRQYRLKYTLLSQPSGAPIAGAPVEVKIISQQMSGCHQHSDNDAPRPSGCLGPGCDQAEIPVATGTTNAEGEFTVEYTTPVVSGLIDLLFYPTTSGYPFYYPETPGTPFYAPHDTLTALCIMQQGLFEMPRNDDKYLLVGTTDEHPSPANHYGTNELITLVPALADSYRTRYPEDPLLAFNDMSLPWGGIFDLGPSPRYPNRIWWSNPHEGHRDGRNVDMRSWSVPASHRRQLKEMALKHGLGIHRECNKDGSENHWHLTAWGGKFTSQGRCNLLKRYMPLGISDSLYVHVIASVQYDPESELYTYDYTVNNLTTSQRLADVFVLTPVPEDAMIVNPPHWTHVVGYQGDPRAVAWAVTEIGDPPPDWEDDGGYYPSPHSPGPGESVSGFSIVSAIPPDTLTYFVQGWYDIPDGGDDVTMPDVFTDSVSDQVVGPVPVSGVSDPERETPKSGTIRSFPNPFNLLTTIEFEVRRPAHVVVTIFNVRGERVCSLHDGRLGVGRHRVNWNARSDRGSPVGPGVYFCVVTVDGVEQVQVHKMVLLK